MFLQNLLDFFIPRICPGCNRKLNPQETLICETCSRELTYCTSKILNDEYKRKFTEFDINEFISLYIFHSGGPVQKLIHELKYRKKFGVGIFLGKTIGAIFKGKILSWKPDLLIPVPLHRLKKAERGFNQARMTAKGIREITGIPINTRILHRKKYTQTQTKLNLIERNKNVENAFTVSKRARLSGRNIILIDDVITTGSTLKECARALKNAGAGNIYGISIALAGLSHSIGSGETEESQSIFEYAFNGSN